VREAFRVAQEERPGPVHLELPEDIAAEKCEEVALILPHSVELPLAAAEALDRAAQLIMAAERPLDQFPDFGMTFNNPDFVKYAEAYGARGTRVDAIDEFIPTLERAFTEGGVHLVAVPIDYSENTRVLVEELRERLPAAGRP
jgi:thiamine pyrophosphate-dependent acetolactate synthase large subunit-like protein